VVVNNAGVLRDSMFHKMKEEDWHTVLGVTLSGYFYVSRAAANLFKAQNSGCYIHMSSTSGLIGNFGQVNYGAAKMGVAGLSKCIALDLTRFNVRSNCIAPFAFTRMTASIPADSEENRRRLSVLQQMTAGKIAPFTVALMSDAAADVTGQIFGVRNNEIVLFTQPRPLRTTQKSDGWTAESCVETALPALRPSMYKLDRSSDVFAWDPF
jgi:NAD(P)-dependent dehydrogenase (short-subunit alcohol dehydrogenase family)